MGAMLLTCPRKSIAPMGCSYRLFPVEMTP